MRASKRIRMHHETKLPYIQIISFFYQWTIIGASKFDVFFGPALDSFWIEPGGLFDLPGGVGGLGVWVNVAGGPPGTACRWVGSCDLFFSGWNSTAIWGWWDRIHWFCGTLNNSCGILRQPMVLVVQKAPIGSTSKLPSARSLFSLSRWLHSRWQSREDHQKEEGGGILDSVMFHLGQPTSKISSVSGWKTSFPTDVSTTTALGSGILDSIRHAKTLAMDDYCV